MATVLSEVSVLITLFRGLRDDADQLEVKDVVNDDELAEDRNDMAVYIHVAVIAMVLYHYVGSTSDSKHRQDQHKDQPGNQWIAALWWNGEHCVIINTEMTSTHNNHRRTHGNCSTNRPSHSVSSVLLHHQSSS
jgi:hypothetical protein